MAEGAIWMQAFAGQHPFRMHASAAHVAAVLCADIRVSCSIFLVFEYCTHDLGQLVDAMPRHFSPSEVKCLMLQVFLPCSSCHTAPLDCFPCISAFTLTLCCW